MAKGMKIQSYKCWAVLSAATPPRAIEIEKEPWQWLVGLMDLMNNRW